MVKDGWLKKEGMARSTIYVRNTEEIRKKDNVA